MVASNTLDALNAIGGDLSLSITFVLGMEFVHWSRDVGLLAHEVAAILLFVIILTSTAPTLVLGVGTPRHKSVASFLILLSNIFGQLTKNTLVQYIAQQVVQSDAITLRSVRVLTLLGVAVFFVFLEGTATQGRVTTLKRAVEQR